jgi:hypothetical protein
MALEHPFLNAASDKLDAKAKIERDAATSF